jgi:hypothetical protein
MSSQISSFFSSVPSTSRLEAPKEIQRAGDFESTRTELVGEEEIIAEPSLDLDRVPRFELLRDRKKLRSFV